MIVQLIYISYSVGDTIDQDFHFIEGVRERNTRRGITSIMLITESCYIHCIEGERNEVSNLFVKIAQDTRHHGATILRFSEMPKREFGDFSGAISRLSDFDTAEYNTVCPSMQIDPTSITSAKAMNLLRRVAAHYRADQNSSNLSY